MEIDIFQKIEKDFGTEAKVAREELDILDAKTKGLIDNRLLRSIIYLAEGNIEKLKMYIAMARLDWRDVLWQAEYDSPDDTMRKRDFNKTFLELGL